jgi:geranylgeranyl diphosphate synthase type I
LHAAVQQLAEPVRRIATYHFGWTTADGRPAAGDSGKMFRAALALRSAEVVAGLSGPGVPAAVAIELLHNSSLLKDDVMDNDRLRRDRPTAWTVFGASEALLASDALMTLAFTVLMRDGGPHGVPAAQLLADTYQQLLLGQMLDVGFAAEADVDLGDCYRMIDGKTAALIACAAEIGAMLAGADAGIRTALRGFGRQLGLAFQIVDDILGIWGDPQRTGKPVGSDIRNRKKSLPVAYALSLPKAGHLIDFYSRSDDPGPDEVQQVTLALEAANARTWAEARVRHHLRAARSQLDLSELAAERQIPLLALADLVTGRSR